MLNSAKVNTAVIFGEEVKDRGETRRLRGRGDEEVKRPRRDEEVKRPRRDEQLRSLRSL